jgi:hypothetical protein
MDGGVDAIKGSSGEPHSARDYSLTGCVVLVSTPVIVVHASVRQNGQSPIVGPIMRAGVRPR